MTFSEHPNWALKEIICNSLDYQLNNFDAWISDRLNKENEKALLDHILHVVLHLNISRKCSVLKKHCLVCKQLL